MTPKPPAPPRPPAGLGKAGAALWRAIVADVGTGWRLDSRDKQFLLSACVTADRIVALEKAIDRDGVTVKGSRGQIVPHPCISEVRQLELVQLRQLSAVELTNPADAKRPASPASTRAQRAAQSRWGTA